MWSAAGRQSEGGQLPREPLQAPSCGWRRLQAHVGTGLRSVKKMKVSCSERSCGSLLLAEKNQSPSSGLRGPALLTPAAPQAYPGHVPGAHVAPATGSGTCRRSVALLAAKLFSEPSLWPLTSPNSFLKKPFLTIPFYYLFSC